MTALNFEKMRCCGERKFSSGVSIGHIARNVLKRSSNSRGTIPEEGKVGCRSGRNDLLSVKKESNARMSR
jgi:hypothetical protein